MKKTVIKVENISKQYRLGVINTGWLSKDLQSWWAHKRGNEDPNSNIIENKNNILDHDHIWALKDVSFEVKKGEVLGIIGKNGAGKSTLLKILTKVTRATSGIIKVKGRVASLLEVGTGFHPELTGRENIYLNGAILGMQKAEISRKLDKIVDFAGIDKFIDTPAKRYSSGMYVRLAFSVAAHLEPDILLVDEVLAVGDAEFQKKCLGKMEDVARGGRTVLFVSHNMAAVRQLCDRGIHLHNGKVSFIGPVLDCINKYTDNESNKTGSILDHIHNINPSISLDSININGSSSDELILPAGKQYLEIEVSGQLSRPMRLEVEARLHDLHGTPLAFFSPGHERGHTSLYPPGHFNIVRRMKLPRITRGLYDIYLFLTDPGVAGWVEIPRAVRLAAEGSPTATGHVFDYHKGTGWVLLSDATKKIK